jgi:hypothetical protein
MFNEMKTLANWKKKYILSMIIGILTLAFSSVNVFGAAPQVVINPQKVEINEAGQEAVVTIDLKGMVDLYGFDVKISYDPSVLEVKDALENDPGIQIEPGAALLNLFWTLNTVDNEKGTIQFVQVGTAGFTGDGTAAKITFAAKKKGSTIINFNDVFLSDAEGQAIIASLNGGVVSVGGVGQGDEPPTGTSNEVPSSPQESNQGGNQGTGNENSTGNNTGSKPESGTPGTGGGTDTGKNEGGKPETGSVINPVSGLIDIKGHWAENSIEKLFQMGILNGYEDKTFKPAGKVTRAEFLKMAVLAGGFLGKASSDTSSFSDYKQIPAWAIPFFRAALGTGLIKGDGDNCLAPTKQITRAELAAVIVRAAGLEQEAREYKGDLSFQDQDKIPAWARGYIGVAVEQGILNGFPDKTFKYDNVATRAETAVMIDRLVEKLRGAQ